MAELDRMRRKVSRLETTLDRLRQTERALERSEKRFRKLSNLTFEGLLIHSRGVVKDMNRALADMVGYSRETLLGRNIVEMLIPEEYHGVIEENLRREHAGPYRIEGLREDGSRVPLEIESRSVDGDCRVTAVRDISERECADQALKEAARQWQATFDAVTDGICLLDVEQKILCSNRTMDALFPQFKGGMAGRHCWEVIHGRQSPRQECPMVRMKRTRRRERTQLVLGERVLEVTVDPIVDAAGSLQGAVHIIRDITERRRAKEALEASETEYRALFEGISDAAFVQPFRRSGFDRFVKVNDIACRKLGYSREELLRMSARDISDPEDVRRYQRSRARDRLMRDKWSVFEAVHIAKDGRRIPVEISSRIFDMGGRPMIMSLARDISERKRAEARTRESEERFRLAFHTSPDSITISRLEDGIYLDVNEGFTRITGYAREEVIGRSAVAIGIWDNPRDRTRFVSELKEKGIVDNLEIRFRHKDGRILYGLMSVATMRLNGEVAALSIVRDITRRKRDEKTRARLEEQLRRSKRLETIGTLAGGIAHDFNNILAPIMGFTELALLKVAADESVAQDLEQVLKSAHRARELIEQILLFSKQSEKEQKPIDLRPVVEEALKLLRPSIPATIEIRSDLSRPCGKVRADATQIHQVVVNLCTNAWQAMGKSGTLRIALEEVDVDATAVRLRPDLNEGRYVRLSVSDTGRGMDEATLDRIFEPFFTTRKKDQGTGLGLSVVHGIVRNHRGDILVASRPGEGSVFHVYLPIIQDGEDIASPQVPQVVSGGSERVLVVDDEAVIAEMVKTMLVRFGYRVDAFSTATDAVVAFEKRPGSYALLISDLTMPHMTGLDLADRLHARRPELPVIILTGFGDSLTGADLRRYGIRRVMGKPVMLRDLAAAVRRVLDER